MRMSLQVLFLMIWIWKVATACNMSIEGGARIGYES